MLKELKDFFSKKECKIASNCSHERILKWENYINSRQCPDCKKIIYDRLNDSDNDNINKKGELESGERNSEVV